LRNQRIRREVDVKNGKKRKFTELDGTMNYDVDTVKERARIIEELALRKEKLISVQFGGGGTVEQASEVNDMLIGAIKAKLAILDKIEK
jgi:hypothetical protein